MSKWIIKRFHIQSILITSSKRTNQEQENLNIFLAIMKTIFHLHMLR